MPVKPPRYGDRGQPGHTESKKEGWCPEHDRPCEWGCEMECYMQDAKYRSPGSSLPDPPTGPKADTFDDEEGQPHAYVEFRASERGQNFWRALEAAALSRLRSGEGRFSTRTFLSQYRDDFKFRINNIFSPWLADDLIVKHPALLDIIERRVRKKPGPDDVDL